MAEENTDEIVSPVTSVKNNSISEDSIDELVSPITSVKNDSMAEDSTDELMSPVTSVKNDSAGKPDKISTGKPRSSSNRHTVLPCYRNSSNSTNNGGNTRRQSTGKLDCPDSGQDVVPHYLRASTGSCHDFCKYGRKHSSEPKPWKPLSKRKNKLPADEQSPARTLIGEAKKGTTAVKQQPATTAGSMLGEEKKVARVEQKPYPPSGSLLGEAKKGTAVKKKPSSPSGSTPGEAKKGTLVKQKPPTPQGSIRGEEKIVNVVTQKPSAPLECILGGEKDAVVEQKPSSPPGSILGEGDEVTEGNQKPSTPLESVLGEEKKVIVVEQKPSDSPESMQAEGKKVTAVEQMLSTSPGSMLGEGKKVSVVNQKPPKSIHSLKLDSSSDKIPTTEKKMKYVSAKQSPPGKMMPKMVKSSSKILGGVDGGGRKDIDLNPRKQTLVSKVSAEKSLKTSTVSHSPKSSSIRPLILRARNNKSLKLLTPLKDQNKMRRDGTNKLNPEKVPEKTLHVIKVEASQKSSTQSRSRSVSNGEGKRVVVASAHGAANKYTSSSKKLSHTAEAETVGKNQKKTLKKGKAAVSDDCNPSAVKLKFRRGKVVDLQQETSSTRRLTFRWARHMGESQDSKGEIRRRIFRKKGVDGDKSSIITGKIVLRHQDVQEKKDAQGLLNNVIEETASKLVESKKSKVKALVGAFETVISLQDKPATVTVS